MDVRLHVIREIEIDNVGYELEVDSADHACFFVFVALALVKHILYTCYVSDSSSYNY